MNLLAGVMYSSSSRLSIESSRFYNFMGRYSYSSPTAATNSLFITSLRVHTFFMLINFSTSFNSIAYLCLLIDYILSASGFFMGKSGRKINSKLNTDIKAPTIDPTIMM